MDDPSALANHLANRITNLTGRVWDDDARQRLAGWLVDEPCRHVVDGWLTYPAAPMRNEDERMREFALRHAITAALGGPESHLAPGLDGFTRRTNWLLPWRRRAPRAG